jgi:hypothetical protein
LHFDYFYILYDLILKIVLLSGGINQYPPPELVKECGGPNRGDTLLHFFTSAKR